MPSIFSSIHRFFFAPRSATSFGLMRMLWAATMLVRMVPQLPDAARYYSDAGVLPRWLEPLFFREQFRYSVLDLTGDPTIVFLIHAGFIVCLVLMLFGVAPRLSTVASVLLTFSFHERNGLMHTGGDTVLRVVGFLLLLAPGIQAFSAMRVREQWDQWKKHGTLLPPLAMPAWPKRLLLWQIVVLYLTSVWSKFAGEMWRSGTALAAALQNSNYGRIYGTAMNDFLSRHARPLVYGTLLYESAWALMLLPQRLYRRIPLLRNGGLRRALILSGILFHIGIQATMYVGVFFWAMVTLLIGLVEQEDIDAVRRWFNRKRTGCVHVLFDGHCGFCQKSVFGLAVMDNLHRLHLVDYHNQDERAAVAPDLPYEALDRALHIRLPDGRTYKAFRAFRVLTWHLPVLWPLAPFLSLPGVSWIGEKVYTRVARKRVRCSHGDCAV